MSKATTFTQIWDESAASVKAEIKAMLMYRLRITDATFWRWTRGHYPAGYAAQVAVATAISEVLGTPCKAEDLFPMK